MGIQLIADSCCDSTPEIISKLELHLVPLKLEIDSRFYVDDGTINQAELMSVMSASSRAVVSSCPSPEEYAQYMRKFDDCIVVTISSKLSGSYNSACAAKNMIKEEFPEKNIYILDSKSASAGELSLALYLKEQINAGDSFAQLILKGKKRADQMQTYFVLEDLSNLVKNGRMSKVTGVVAAILSLCPILGDNGDGEIQMLAKARGNSNALKKLKNLVFGVTEKAEKGSIRMVLSYCGCYERAKDLRDSLLTICPAIGDIVMVPTGGLSTVYANRGGIIVAF